MHLEELADQKAKVMGVAARYWDVMPPADLPDQLPQAAALKLQAKKSRTTENKKKAISVLFSFLIKGGEDS